MRLAAVIALLAASASAMSPGSVEYAARWIGEYAATAANEIPTDGLIAYWKPSVTLDATDSYGTYDGVLQGDAVATTNGFELDGSGDYVLVADNDVFTQPNGFTLLAWLWHVGTNNARFVVWAKYLEPTNVEGFGEYSTLEAYRIGIYGQGLPTISIVQSEAAGSYVTASNWTHVAFSYEGGNNRTNVFVYRDGTLTRASSPSATATFTNIANGTADFHIGANVNIGSYSLGRLDRIAWYSRCLSSNEIYAAFTNTIGYYE